MPLRLWFVMVVRNAIGINARVIVAERFGHGGVATDRHGPAQLVVALASWEVDVIERMQDDTGCWHHRDTRWLGCTV